jgi:hypothetical protein
MLVNFQRIARRYIPEDITLQQRFDSKYHLPTVIHPGGKVMAQADFGWECIGPLHFVDDIKVKNSI